jgi:hypothetical protein
VDVAEAAAAGPGHDDLLAGGDEVGDQGTAVVLVDRRPRGHRQVDVLAGLAVAPRSGAATTWRGPEVMGVAEVTQGGLAGVDAQIDGAAAAAVAAVGAAARNVRLAAEGRGPVAAVAGTDPDLHAIEEHRA